MAYLKISKHNPVALRQSNSNYEAIKPLFCDLLKDFEHYVEYYQKYQNSDTINVQYSTDDITTTATMKLVSCSNSYNFTISQITPNIEYVGGKRFYKSTLDLASVVEGYYQIHFDIEIDSKTYYFTSEPIYIKSAHDNTMLLKYTHDLNQYDMLFLNSLGNNEFYLRVEGGCKQSDISPNSKDSIFIGMNYDSVQLDARPYPLYKFTFGDCLGLPFWLIEIINNAISLNEVYFDDIRYSKNEGAKLEKEQIDNDNYPLNLYTVEMLKVPMDYAIDFNDGLPVVTTTDISNIDVNAAVSGGEVTDEGDCPVTARGICYDTSTNPDLTKTKTLNGTGLGVFTSNMVNLLENTQYYVRAYATNLIGTSYGEVKTFTTEYDEPSAYTYLFEHIRSIGNLDIKFKISNKDSEGIGTFVVDFGDESRETVIINTETNGGTEITHTYAAAGTYIVALIGTEANHNKISIIDNLVAERNEMTKFYGSPYWINLKELIIRGFDETNTGMQLQSITTKAEWVSLQKLWLHNNKELTSVQIHNTWVLLSSLMLYNNKLSTISNHTELIGIIQANISFNQLTETAVNNYLIVEDSKNITSGRIIYLDNGTNAAPTGAGITAKNNLISRGYTVITN